MHSLVYLQFSMIFFARDAWKEMSELDRYLQCLTERYCMYMCSIIDTLQNGELISEDEVRGLCNIGREILAEEANIQRVDAPVTVHPDIMIFI